MKKQTRIKINLPILHTRDDAESCMTDLAHTINNQRKLVAQRDTLVLTINKKFESQLGECEIAIKEKSDALRAWAESNPDQFPKDRKSLDLTSGILGFRTGTPKLALISRAFTWERVTELLRTAWSQYVRIKEDVAKDLILSDYAQNILDDQSIRRVGLKVVQDESFYIDPKLADVETRQTVEAK